MDQDINFLCETIKNTEFIIDEAEEYEILCSSQDLTIDMIDWNFISKTKTRYLKYISQINFDCYAEAGERIIILINDYIKCCENPIDRKLMACKCQIIDMLIIRLLKWTNEHSYSNDDDIMCM